MTAVRAVARSFVTTAEFWLRGGRRCLLVFITLSTSVARAQGLAPARWTPVRNAVAAPPPAAVSVEFTQTLSTSSPTASALALFSSQAGGYKPGVPAVRGNTLTYHPSAPFKAGEVVSATVTTAVQSSGGQNLTRPYVFQFTTATAPSTGLFSSQPDVPLSNPFSLAVGDIDSDGDLDLLAVNSVSTGPENTVSVRLNTGAGTFVNGQEIPGVSAGRILLGDLDNDGDLDLVTSGGVRLNSGGTFGPPQPAGVGGAALGDVDGDGDLDAVTEGATSSGPAPGTVVRVRLNNGRGGLSEGPVVPVSLNAATVVLGDVNNDGALDLLASGRNGLIDVRLNTGQGSFASTGQRLNIATMPGGLLLGDVDGDGDLDLLAANTGSTVTVVFNDGQGTFGGSRFVNLGSFAVFAALGDMDGDGDLDLLAGGFPNSVSLRRNDGLGNFSGDQTMVVPESPRALAVGDLDGDGTLDFATANSSSGTGGSASIRLNPATAPLRSRYRIKAGGAAVSTTRGTFGADQYYAPTPGNTFSSPAAIAGTPDDALYQAERYGTNGVMRYAFPVVNGPYTVKLHFAELYWTRAGQRVFDVALENSPVLTAYDIFKKAGANAALVESFPVTVNDGILNLDFTALNSGGLDNPQIAAIEVLPGTEASSPTAYRINSGGEALVTASGVFSADQAFSPAPGNTFGTSSPIAGTPDEALYQTERYDRSGTFAYALPLANGSYKVTLHFAEIYFTAAGQRVFDVSLEDRKLLAEYDIYKKVGAFTATTEVFTVPVTDSTLNVLFTSQAAGGRENPKVSAIEVEPVEVTAPRAPATLHQAAAQAPTRLEAYPNPLTGRGTLHFRTPVTGPARVVVYNVLGQRVATLFDDVAEAGRDYARPLDATRLPAGVYFCRLHTGSQASTQRRILVN
ncbi:malectin domain-containing carbohydrate-binding protein [Hymenobacter fodinae]|uniref:T9SS type A sorting domain-containing protein n=1 Tax=Hymenobacter fodinae TaxID=2510796 RepID=A0A4Z0NYP1_9BACT|nr:malectin domain-containing carbohydrate-binding protein [Hymenobacter fodinae]TGE03760.1 T9SS type A sorting domain-containing protein [Hymenobacter fodinae]